MMKRKTLDNRGSTLVIVMIAMSIVAMLAVVALWISLINFEMKTTDIELKDNFYSAESVLDQICVGLQGDISDAYREAYLDVMQNYSLYDEAARNERFAVRYIGALRNQLKANGSDLNYDINNLISYVDPKLTAANASPKAVVECTSAADAANQYGLLSTYDTGLVIKGVKVTFTDEKGFVSIIETDISLAIPKMNFTTSEELPEIFSYALIATQGTQVKGDSTNLVQVAGNVYSGSPFVADNSKVDELTSVNIEAGKKLELKDSQFFIAQGIVDLKTSSNLTVPSGCQFWTDNINVNSALVSLKGNTYVSDDLTLSGSGAKAFLGENNSGKYVGYGNSKQNANDSSAIIINGAESTLDLTGLKELMLAGYAYINTGAIAGSNGIVNSNIQTGDSISVKGNQIAYLVPAECLYTEGNGTEAKSKFTRNPLSYAEYKLVSEDSKYVPVNTDVITSKIGKPLKNYLSAGKNIDECVKKIFVPSADGSSDNGYVYFYMDLGAQQASEFYKDFYDADSEKLNLYTDFYTNYIKTNEDVSSSIYMVGNYSLYNDKNLSLMKGLVQDIDIDAETNTLENTYTALSKKLIKNYAALTSAEVSNTIYYNLINEENLKEITNSEPGFMKKFSATNADGSVSEAIIINDDYVYDGSNQNIRLIVSTGNVTVKGDFTGTIIAKGKVDITTNCTISNASEEVFKRLLPVPANEGDETSLMLYNVFVQGNSYLANSLVGENVANADDSKILYSDIISYQNWNKK